MHWGALEKTVAANTNDIVVLHAKLEDKPFIVSDYIEQFAQLVDQLNAYQLNVDPLYYAMPQNLSMV